MNTKKFRPVVDPLTIVNQKVRKLINNFCYLVFYLLINVDEEFSEYVNKGYKILNRQFFSLWIMYSIDVSLNLIREADGTELNAPDLSDKKFWFFKFWSGFNQKGVLFCQ